MDPLPKGSSAVHEKHPISLERQQIVERERQVWIKKLIDVSRRNNLLYYRTLKNGTLDLTSADEMALRGLMNGESISLRKLIWEDSDVGDGNGDEGDIMHKLQEIARRALSNKEEKGLQTMFIALGKATWPAEDEGRPTDAPVLLLPIELESRGRDKSGFIFHNAGPIQPNLVLLHVLETELGVRVAPEDLLPASEEAQPFDLEEVYTRLRAVASEQRGFEVQSRAVLGNFAFQKMAMVRDLRQLGQQLTEHDLIAALAGDLGARRKCSESQRDLSPRELDKIPPENEFAIMDADSSQQSAMSLVLSGQDSVIHGPPGTGKSQTIANLIASFAARGQRVLFVAEKRAALEVVLDRLNRVGLGHLSIDLHGADISPKRVLKQIGAALDLVRSSALIDCTQLHQRFVERRARLNAHVDRMHRKRPPSDETLYQLQGKLMRLPADARTDIRWRGAELNPLVPKQAERIRDLIGEAGGFASLFLGMDASPWTGALLPDGASTQAALDLAQELSLNKWPAALANLGQMTRATGLTSPTNLDDFKRLLDLVSDVQSTLSNYSDSLFKLNLAAVVRNLAPGSSGGLSGIWAWFQNTEFRVTRKLLLSLRTAGKTNTAELASEVDAALNQSTRWRSLAKQAVLPGTLHGYANYRQSFEDALQDLSLLSTVVPRKNLLKLPLDKITECLRELAHDTVTAHRIPKVLSTENELKRLGVGKFIEELRTRPRLTEFWSQMFDYAWWSSCIDAARLIDPDIAGFSGRTHDQYVRDFIELDRERVRLAAARVKRANAERAIAAMNEFPEGRGPRPPRITENATALAAAKTVRRSTPRVDGALFLLDGKPTFSQPITRW